MSDILDSNERQRALLTVLNACPVPMALNDSDLNVTFVNSEFTRAFGYSLQDIPTLTDWWLKAYPDFDYRQAISEAWRAHADAALNSAQPFEPVEAVIRCKNGDSRTAWVNAAALGEEYPGLHLVILYDVSEQLQTNAALTDAHRLLQSVIDTIPMRVFWKDLDSRYLGCNTQFAKDSGKHLPEELLGKDDRAMAWKDQADLYRADDKQVIDSGIARIGFEEPQTTPDGRQIWLRTSKVPLRNTAEEVIGVLGIYDDITEIKESAARLQMANERYRILFDASPVPLSVTDVVTGRFLAVNNAALEQYGYTREEAERMNVIDLIVPEDRVEVAAMLDKVKHGYQHPSHSIRQHLRKDGSRMWVQVDGHEIEFEGQRARIAQTHDITAQIEATNELQAAEARYRLLFDASPVPMAVFDTQTFKILAVNDAALETFGYTRDDVTDQRISALFFPEDLPNFIEFLSEELKHPELESHSIKRHRKKDGTAIWCEVSAQNIVFSGQPARIVQAVNITKRMEAEDELRKTEARYRLLFDASPVPLAVIEIETLEFLAFNDAALDLYGYAREDAATVSAQEMFLPEDIPAFLAHWSDASKHHDLITHSLWRQRKRDGSMMWVESTAHTIDYFGRPARIVQALDVTQRIHAENELRQAEEHYRQLFQAHPVPIAIYDAFTLEFSAVNDAAIAQYGYSRDEFLHMKAQQIFMPEELPRMKQYVEQEIQPKMQGASSIWRHRRKDGSAFWVELSGRKLDYQGQPMRIVEAQDITRRVEAEDDLRKAEAHYRLLFESNPVPMSIYDPVTLKFLAVNQAALDEYGFTRDECLNMTVAALYEPSELPRLKIYISEVTQQMDHAATSVWKHRRKDGSTFWVQVTAHDMEFKGQPARVALSQDISSIVISEQREHARSEVLELLAKGAPLRQVLETIVHNVENERPATRCSILLLDESGEHLLLGAAPSLPDFYNEAVNGLKIGPGIGSCGSAAWSGQRVVVEDIQSHDYWRAYREIAAQAQLGSCWSNPITAASGKVIGTMAVYQVEKSSPTEADIELIEHFTHLAAVAIERSMASEELQLASLVYENSSEAMVVTDADNLIIAINPAFTQLTGYTLDEIRGKNPSILNSGHQDEDFYNAMWKSISSTGQWQGEIWNKRKDGSEYAEWLTINSIYGDDGKVHRRVALFSDITDRKNAEALIWNQANFDTLTQLPNRRLFQDRLTQELRKAHRDRLLLGLLFIDLDRFKEVNDTLGHQMGDDLLVQASLRIQQCVRESDSVARLGGDEFTVILPDVTDIADIARVADNIIVALGKPFTLGNDQAYISASVGITVYPEDADNVEGLLKNADQAMYAAKRAGRNRYGYFTASMQEASNMRMRLVRDIHLATAAGQFMIYFQPIVELATGRIHKAEALLRWQHPQQGFISPAIFIPIAEDTGLIHDIGNWVFTESVRQVKKWRAQYSKDFQISVNKSPVQFRAEDQVHDNWVTHLEASGLGGDSIVIEITEGLLLHADSSINKKLLMFRDAGIQVAIDDFGTGYSSLSYLKKFDIDYLKIDQSFVRSLDTDSSDLALSEAIVVMAHKLGLKVIAEGVETEQQRDLLIGIGCDYAQGYLYSRPVPADDFELFMQANAAGTDKH